jgi:hypothetical protein
MAVSARTAPPISMPPKPRPNMSTQQPAQHLRDQRVGDQQGAIAETGHRQGDALGEYADQQDGSREE